MYHNVYQRRIEHTDAQPAYTDTRLNIVSGDSKQQNDSRGQVDERRSPT